MRRAICKYVSLVCILVALVHGGQARKNVKVEKVTDTYGLSEGPHWDHRTQKLYFVDIYNQYVRRLDPATGVVTSAYIDHGTVGVAVPVDDSVDQLIVGSGKDVILVTWDGESNKSKVPIKVLCSVDSPEAQTRINDGKVDSAGRFWLGTMGNEVNGQIASNLGTLYRVDDDLEPKKKISPVTISNGLAWNIEDDTLYYIDSTPRQVAAYDYNPNNGTISNKRIVFDLNKTDLKGLPDGMTIDTDGNLWIALFGGSRVICVDPKTKKVLCKVEIPAENVTSVAFGGPLLDTLYVTTSGFNISAEQRQATPYAGAIFAVTGLEVRGLLANSFTMID
ncbi:RGN protein, partial [Acromyrmex charruanus]